MGGTWNLIPHPELLLLPLLGISLAGSALRGRPAPIQVALGLRESTREAEGPPYSYQGGTPWEAGLRSSRWHLPLLEPELPAPEVFLGTERGRGQWLHAPGLASASFVTPTPIRQPLTQVHASPQPWVETPSSPVGALAAGTLPQCCAGAGGRVRGSGRGQVDMAISKLAGLRAQW